jgi:hypothetical protein
MVSVRAQSMDQLLLPALRYEVWIPSSRGHISNTVGASATHIPAGTAPTKLLPALVGAAQGMRAQRDCRESVAISASGAKSAEHELLALLGTLPAVCLRASKEVGNLGIATTFGVGDERIHLEGIG